jgi:lauroyl/myristoyl acyltransferase
MGFRDLVSSRVAVRLALYVGQHMPPRVGYWLAGAIADLIAQLQPEMYRTVRANLSQVTGEEAEPGTLDQLARSAFYEAGRAYYDFLHLVDAPLQAHRDAVFVPEQVVAEMRSTLATGRGLLLIGPHMSNFNLGIAALAAHGLSIQVLTLSNPRSGYQAWNRLLSRTSVEVTPISSSSLRLALRRLRSGGAVFTGADLPVSDEGAWIEFFGRPAHMPTGHVRLALMADAVVFVGTCYRGPDSDYVLEFSRPVEMERTGDRDRDVVTNTGRLLRIVERFVRACPQQWLMFHPVWN